MAIEKLKRVIWRMMEEKPNAKYYGWKDLERAIMFEVGTDRRTFRDNKEALKRIGWIVIRRKRVYLTSNAGL